MSSEILPVSALAYLAGFLAALVASRLRGRWRTIALALLGGAGLIALVYVDIDLYRRISSRWDTPGEVIVRSERLWLWSATFLFGILYSSLRSAAVKRVKTGRRAFSLVGAIALVISVIILMATAAVRIAGIRIEPAANVVVSVQPEHVVLAAVRSDGGIGLRSTYFDLPHQRVRIKIEAAAATILELRDSRLVRIDISTPATPKIVVARDGKERVIRKIEDVTPTRRFTTKQRLTIESLHLSLPEWATGIPTVRPAAASQRETSHAILLSSSPIPAFLDPGGIEVKSPANSFTALRERHWDPATLTSLLLSFRDNPVWTSFGTRWSSTLESETRELLGLRDRGVFILPAADISQGEHAGRLHMALRAPADFILVMDEAHIFDGLAEAMTGLVVVFVKAATVAEVQPLRLEPSSRAIFMRWALATETLDDSHGTQETAVGSLQAGNGRGRVSVGQVERTLDSDVNTIALSSDLGYPEVRVRWTGNRLHASCSARTVDDVALNGTSLLPTIWGSLSNEARVGVAGGAFTFLIGLMFANKADVRRLWRWMLGHNQNAPPI